MTIRGLLWEMQENPLDEFLSELRDKSIEHEWYIEP